MLQNRYEHYGSMEAVNHPVDALYPEIVTAAASEDSSKSSSANKPQRPRRVLSTSMRLLKDDFKTKGLPKTTTKPIDYVIVYRNLEDSIETGDEQSSCGLCCCGKASGNWALEAHQKQKRFKRLMEREGIEVAEEHTNEEKHLTYLLLHTPFWRLCAEAERVCLKAPLKDCISYESGSHCCVELMEKLLKTDNEDDYVSGPFLVDRFKIYKDSENADKFFRPAIRSLLTNSILKNICDDTRNREAQPIASMIVENQNYVDTSSYQTTKQGLPYMLHNKYYLDAFTLHDKTLYDPFLKIMLNVHYAKKGADTMMTDLSISSTALIQPEDVSVYEDTRQDMDRTWARSCRFQPLWKIRNYFGEKIALYFAWCGILIMTLWVPMLAGIAVFVYGLYLSATKHYKSLTTLSYNVTNTSSGAIIYVEESISIVKESFDNDATPYYALIITIWGTLFLEIWKRTNSRLSYGWDVDTYENTEPDRPEFVGNKIVKDPVTNQLISDTTTIQKLLRFSVSIGTFIFMVCLVFIVVAGVIIYRVVLTVDYCSNMSSTSCLIVTTVGSSLLNAVAIVVLGKIYDFLAVHLTNWENHRTQTEYNNSLIIKVFAFQFANSYASLFYIAFFRGRAFQNGIFGLGSQYTDTCGDVGSTCMSMLSIQVLTLMLTKPLPKLLADILIPVGQYLWLTKMKPALKRCKSNDRNDEMNSYPEVHTPPYWEIEHMKPDPGDFTLMEYTEKVIIYGFVMLFAVSLSLAPLIAFVIIAIDIRVDAKRMLWLSRRPMAFIAEDIGMWYTILEFVNIIGVITNAFLIAFTSAWGQQYDTVQKLIIVIIFEHFIFAIKYILAALIPDVPEDIRLAQRREIYQNQMIREDEKFSRNVGGSDTLVEENEEVDGRKPSKGSLWGRKRDTRRPVSSDEDEDAANASRRGSRQVD